MPAPHKPQRTNNPKKEGLYFSAFGESLIEKNTNYGQFSSPYRFNGKELDPETGNYYYGARYYNPTWSVWLGVDAMSGSSHNLSLTPYHFSANNPVMIIDPDGNDWFQNENTGEIYYNNTMTKGDAGTGDMTGEGWIHLGENGMFGEKDWNVLNNSKGLSDGVNYQLSGSYETGNLQLEMSAKYNAENAEKFMGSKGYELKPTQVTESERVQYLINGQPAGNHTLTVKNIFLEQVWEKMAYQKAGLHAKTTSSIQLRTRDIPFGHVTIKSRIIEYERSIVPAAKAIIDLIRLDINVENLNINTYKGWEAYPKGGILNPHRR